MRSVALLLALLLLAPFAGADAAQTEGLARLLRYPDASADKITFVYAGDIWVVENAGGTARRLTSHVGEELFPKFSPDGRWIAFIATEAGQSNLYVQSFPEPGSKSQITFPNPTFVAWVTRGDELLVADNTGDIHSVQVSTTAGFHQGATTHLFKLPPGVFPISGDATMQRFLTGSAKDQATSSQLEVVLGWPQLLEKK